MVFKSSPIGTQSHGYEANNSFLLWAYGQRLLVRTGHYDIYGSEHHRDWMWSTRSLNNITVDGHGQAPRPLDGQGPDRRPSRPRPSIDAVVGEAGEAYRVIEPAASDAGCWTATRGRSSSSSRSW